MSLLIIVNDNTIVNVTLPQLVRQLGAGLPGHASAAAHDSLGAALQVSEAIGPSGAALAEAARGAFVHAMARSSIFAAVIALMGALFAWRYLPARASQDLARASMSPKLSGNRSISCPSRSRGEEVPRTADVLLRPSRASAVHNPWRSVMRHVPIRKVPSQPDGTTRLLRRSPPE